MIEFISQQKNRKIITFIVSLILVWNSFFLPIAVSRAEETTTPPAESALTQESSPPADSSQLPEQPQSPEEPQAPEESITNQDPQPTDSGSELNTGDAVSTATQVTDLNRHEIETDGQITVEGCDVEVDLECPVDIENRTHLRGGATAESNTGQNTARRLPGDSEINTGDAISNATNENQVNTNIIEATESAETETEARERGDSTVELENDADLTVETTAESISGQNESLDNEGNAAINTGVSIAQADQVNLVNTNIIGSNFEYYLLSLFGEQSGDIDLNALWKQLLAAVQTFDASADLTDSNLAIYIANNADLDLSANATAISGQNEAYDNEGNATINTQDSIAVANIFNLINLNILGSDFWIGVINIFGNFTGDIIVPNMDRFSEELSALVNSEQMSEIIAQNYATVRSNVLANADSGTNTQRDFGSEVIETGDATALANSTTYTNVNLFLTNFYSLLLNIFGFWNGGVVSWMEPGAYSNQTGYLSNYQFGNFGGLGQLGNNNTGDGQTGSDVDIENRVHISADVSAEAISGQNNTAGNQDSTITTGNAFAMANLFNFLNSNFIGSKFFLPIINLFGSWTGNLIFAYPSLAVDLVGDKQDVHVGDTVNYTVSWMNVGYDEARNSEISVSLPAEMTINSVSGGENVSQSDHTLNFTIGEVKPKQGGSFSFNATITGLISQSKNNGFLSKMKDSLIKVVEAAEASKALVTTATINTSDSQADRSKNSSSFTVYLNGVTSDENVSDQSSEEQLDKELVDEPSVDNRLPILEITSENNVGEYVYPSDVITYTVRIKNNGEGTAKDTMLYQTIFNGSPLSTSRIKVGDIGSGGTKKVTFGLQVPTKAPAGLYTSEIVAVALSVSGVEVESNVSLTEFLVKTRLLNLAPAVQAKEETGDVLAATNTKQSQNNYANLLSLAFALLWFVEMMRRRRAEERMELLLKQLKSKRVN